MRRIRSRPSKPLSALAAVVGLGFVAFGVIGCIYILPSKAHWAGKLFALLWTLTALGMLVYHCANLFSASGVADEIIEIDRLADESRSPEERLKRLADLLAKGLITQSEHDQQRQRILDEL